MEDIIVLSSHTKFRLLNKSYIDKIDTLGYVEFLTKDLRGHGILILNINNTTIAAPLRSNMSLYRNGSAGFFTYKEYVNIYGKKVLKGIDISKMLFVEAADINESSTYTFQDLEEEKFYQDNFDKYKRSVAKYINEYIKICKRIKEGKKPNWFILKEYRYSTLQNFHSILGITLTAYELQEEIFKRDPYSESSSTN